MINLSEISLDYDFHVDVFLAPTLHIKCDCVSEPIEHCIVLLDCRIDLKLCLVHDSKINGIYDL